jgi:hypothetical protein
VNSKAIQTIIAIVFIILFLFYIILQTKQTKKIYNLIGKQFKKLFRKSRKSLNLTDEYNAVNDDSSIVIDELEQAECHQVTREQIDSNNFNKQESAFILRTISKLIESRRKKVANFFLNSYIYGYILMIFMVLTLSLIQILLIDVNTYELNMFKRKTKENSQIILSLCKNLEKNYYTEEFIYLVFATLFFLLLIFKQKKRRFSYYIMKKFRKHPDLLEFNSSNLMNSNEEKEELYHSKKKLYKLVKAKININFNKFQFYILYFYCMYLLFIKTSQHLLRDL